MNEVAFQHLLFTLVFNLKFNLLKQLKAHTSQPNTHTFAYMHDYTRVRTHSKPFIRICICIRGISPTVKSALYAAPSFDRQFIHATKSKSMQKDWMKMNEQKKNNRKREKTTDWQLSLALCDFVFGFLSMAEIDRLDCIFGWWLWHCVH